MNQKIILSLVAALTLPAMSATNAELEAMLIKMQKDFAQYKVAQEKKISSLEKQLAQKSQSNKSAPKPSEQKTVVAHKSTKSTAAKKHTPVTQKSQYHSVSSTTHEKAETNRFAATANTEVAAETAPSDEYFGFLKPDRAGFRVANTDMGTLNISFWTYARYINSLNLKPTYTDASGGEHDVLRRNDITLSKVNAQFKGWILDENLHYLLYVWTNNNDRGNPDNIAFAGNLQYTLPYRLMIGAGFEGLPTGRSMEGMHPRLNRVDVRSMSAEYFRGSYTNGVWLEGEPVDDVYFRTVLANNLNQVGTTASQLDTGLNTWSTGIWWLPNGEYARKGKLGAGGAYGDFEQHQTPAFRLGAHYTTSVESEQSQASLNDPENSQIRLSDGRLIFKSNEIFGGAQLDTLHFQVAAVDAGVKYKGFALEGEAYYRYLNDFTFSTGNPDFDFTSLTDYGFSIQPSYMLLYKTLQAYVVGSKIYGDYGNPWDVALGLNWYPIGTKHPEYGRQFRVNADAHYSDLSAIGNPSIPYSAGGEGWVYSISAELWF